MILNGLTYDYPKMTTSLPTTPTGYLQPPTHSPITALTYSSSLGQYILLGTASRQITLHNPTTGSTIQSYSAHGYSISALSIAPDNASFASSGGDKAVFLWDVAKAVTIKRFAGHESRVEDVAMGGVTVREDGGEGGDRGAAGRAGLGQVVVSGSFDKTVRVWDVRGGGRMGCVMVLPEAKDGVLSVGCDDNCLWSGSTDGRVREYDLRRGLLREDVIGAPVTSVTASRDGGAFLVGSLDGKIRLMDRRDGRCLATYEGHKNTEYRVWSRLVGRDEDAVISGSEDGKVVLWDRARGGKPSESLEASRTGKLVSCVAYNPATNGWASGGSDSRVTLWGPQK